MLSEDRPTLGERYSSACESSNLKLSERRRGDVDMVIAAGLVREGLAATLYRLQVEYDGVRANHQAAQHRVRALEQMAGAERGECDETGETAEQRAEKIMRIAENDALISHCLILSALPSLRTAKEQFRTFAGREAGRRNFKRPEAEITALAGQVLDVFLNPNCRHCSGRGFNGGRRRDDPQILCRPCKGAGHRRDDIGKDAEQRSFAGRLLMSTDALMFQLQRDIRTNLNAIEEAKGLIEQAISV